MMQRMGGRRYRLWLSQHRDGIDIEELVVVEVVEVRWRVCVRIITTMLMIEG